MSSPGLNPVCCCVQAKTTSHGMSIGLFTKSVCAHVSVTNALLTTAHVGVHVLRKAAPGATGVVIALREGATGGDAAAQLVAAAATVPAAGVPLPLLMLLAGPADEGGASVEAVARERLRR